jgi:predicted ATP-binding protein involved in virulence
MTPIKIEKLRLENFRCFRDIDLTLHPELTVLIAENGQGKSSILDAVRIALWPFVSSFDLARNAFNDPGNAITIDDVRLIKLETGDMARQLPARVAMTGDFGDGNRRTWIRYRDKEARSTKTKDDGDTAALKRWASAIQQQVRDPEQPVLDLPVFGYYGTGRLWSQKKLMETVRGKDDTKSTDFYVRTFAYQNCLDPASTYKHFKEWFIWAFESYREQQIKRLEKPTASADVTAAQERLLVVQQAIDTLLQSVTGWHTLEYSISHEKAVVLHHDVYGTLDVEALSDGIRSVLAMVGDIAYRCIKLNPHLGAEAARNTAGVVMIDEVDMHLHPRWQQVVLGQLRSVFPKVQLIVTTHSPQVLTTVAREHIRVIRPTEAGFEASVPEFSPLAHESGDALAKVMGTHREPELPLQESIRRFEQLVRAGQEETDDAVKLRLIMDEAGYQIHDSDLATWRFLASRRKQEHGRD